MVAKIKKGLWKSCVEVMSGQTGRSLSHGLKKHQWAVKSFDTNASVLAEHVFSKDHRIVWEDASILDHHSLQLPQLMVESWYITKVPDTLNREKGPLPEQYTALPCRLGKT